MHYKYTIAIALLLVAITPSKAETNIRYCYNCEIKKTVVKRYNTPALPLPVIGPVAVAPMVAAPVVVSPYPYPAAVPIQAPVAYVAG